MLVMPKNRKVAWIPVECLVDAKQIDGQKFHFNQPLLEALKQVNFESIYVFFNIRQSATPLARKIRQKFTSDVDLRLNEDIIEPFLKHFYSENEQISTNLEEGFVVLGNPIAPPTIVIERQAILYSFNKFAENEAIRGNLKELELKMAAEPLNILYFFSTKISELPSLMHFLAIGKEDLKKHFRFESVGVDSEATSEEYLEKFGNEFSLENYSKMGLNSYHADIDKLTRILNKFRFDLIAYFHAEILKKKAPINQNSFLDEIDKLELVASNNQVIEGLNKEITWPERHPYKSYSSNSDSTCLISLIKKLSNYLEILQQERFQINMNSHDLSHDYIQQLLPIINGFIDHREKDDSLQMLLSQAKNDLFLFARSIVINTSTNIKKPSKRVEDSPKNSVNRPARPLVIGKPITQVDSQKYMSASHLSIEDNIENYKKIAIQLKEDEKEKSEKVYKILFTHLVETFQGNENKVGKKQAYLDSTEKRSNLRSFFGFDKRDPRRDVAIAEIDACIKRLSEDLEKSENERYQELLDTIAYQKLLTNAFHTAQFTHHFFRTESHLELTLTKVSVGHISFNDWENYKNRFQSQIQKAMACEEALGAGKSETGLLAAALGATIKFIFALYAIWMVASDYFAV